MNWKKKLLHVICILVSNFLSSFFIGWKIYRISSKNKLLIFAYGQICSKSHWWKILGESIQPWNVQLLNYCQYFKIIIIFSIVVWIFFNPSLIYDYYGWIWNSVAKRPVGVVEVKIVRAKNFPQKYFMGNAYVKIQIANTFVAKTTRTKMNTFVPEWNEHFKLMVQDPKSQLLELHVYDWEKVWFLLSHLKKNSLTLFQWKLVIAQFHKTFWKFL